MLGWNRILKFWKYGMSVALTKNKTFETEIVSDPDFSMWFNISVKWDRKSNHAGLHIHLELIGLLWLISIHDNRHWDDDNDRWETPRTERKDFRASL